MRIEIFLLNLNISTAQVENFSAGKERELGDWRGLCAGICRKQFVCNHSIGITRDIKKPGSSLPGADIVGLYKYNNEVRFLFGEIKTSSDKNCPPGVMYGEHGLKHQLEDLCEKKEITNQLVQYLAHRLKGTILWAQYADAVKRYISSGEKAVHILGILVRDIAPADADLKTRTKALEKFVSGGRTIELIGIYVPEDEIRKFPQIIQEERERRSISSAEKE